MRERRTYPDDSPNLGRRAGLSGTSGERATDSGIEVHEEEFGTVTAQHVYMMRCECGRSWFELELPKCVRCPGCNKFGVVSS